MLAVTHMHGGTQMPMAELDERQFRQWTALLEQRLGIAVTGQSRSFLSTRLRMRMRELGLEDFQHYFELVTSSRQGPLEWSRLLDRLTIHETCFNRHPASFRLLEEQFLPQLMQQSRGVLNLKAWSVGCASGEEAYYLAMLLERSLGTYRDKAYYGVFGTDISLDSLAQAREGVYAPERLRELDAATRRRYFKQQDGSFRIIDQLRKRVAFSQLNVQSLERAPFGKLDIIFCQNLLIYFSAVRRREIVSTLARFLKPGGILILGVGEIVGWQPAGLEALKFEDTLAYRRAKD